MFRILKAKVVVRLMVFVGIIVILTANGVAYYFSNVIADEAESRADVQMESVQNGIIEVLNAVNDLSLARVHLSMNLFKERSLEIGPPSIGTPIRLNEKMIKTLRFGKSNQVNNYTIVDDILKRTGASATFFVKTDEEYIRISTNVTKSDGSRAVGTPLDPNGKAIAAIRRGESFYGVVDILGRQYMTGYEPIKDRSQNIIGVWFVGFPISELNSVGDAISRTKILENGFVALLDAKKKILFHSSHVTKELVQKVEELNTTKNALEWDLQSTHFAKWGFTVLSAHPQSDLEIKLSEVRMIIALGMVICIVLLLGVIYVFVHQLIIQPVKSITEQMNKADVNTIITSERTDEIGLLTKSFDSFVLSIKNVLLKVTEASAAVASASTEISSGTEQMAAGTQEQRSEAAAVATAVEEMTKTIIESARNADDTVQTAKKAKNAAEAGGKIVANTINEMNEIAIVVNRSAETVKALGKSSDEIGEIISVIDDIADQTNLLALNAAIEAARAGDQGRGFAVVADEVKKLAERTTKATKEISGMIQKIQSDTKAAVTSMQEGSAKVSEGIVLADSAGISLQEIVSLSQVVTDMIGQIAAASEEQSSVSADISKNVEAINSVTQQSAVATEQIARTSEDLNRLTENLLQIINRFHLEDSNTISNKNLHQTINNRISKYNSPKKPETHNELIIAHN